MKRLRHFVATVAMCWMALATTPCLFGQEAEDTSSIVIDVYLLTVRTVTLSGLTRATALDPEIVSVDADGDLLRLTGLQRGETVVIAHLDGKPTSLIVRVILPPSRLPAPSLRGDSLQRGVGTFGSDVQVAAMNGNTSATIVDSLSWRQQLADRQLAISLSADHSTQPGQYGLNLRTGSIDLRTPRFEFKLLDFNVNLTGAALADRVPTLSVSDTLQLRGASVSFSRGGNRFSLYAGATVPYYFLALSSSRKVLGFAYRRQVNDKLALFSAGTYLHLPSTNTLPARAHFMQQGGFTYAPSRAWSMDGVAGISDAGGLARANVNYTGSRFSAFASALYSSPDYPLNQMQSLFAGRSSVRAGITSQWGQHAGGSIYYEHSSVGSALVTAPAATSDFFSPSVTFRLSPRQSATVTYTLSSSEGGFQGGRQSGSRFDASFQSTLSERLMNSLQLQVGSVQDSLQTQSETRFSINDMLSYRIRSALLQASFSYNRTNPSLIQKLNQELAVLSPQLQQLFTQDPSAFVAENLPPDIRSLLEAQQPTSTSVGLTAQLPLTRKLSFTPNFSLNHDTIGAEHGSWASFLGYSLSYQVSPTLQARSSLSSVWTASSSRMLLQRTTVFSVGLMKSFNGSPAHLFARHNNRVIEGRVYRDENINGVYNKGEPGLEGAQVQLDDGMVAMTDAVGVYRFTRVSGGPHRVSLNLAQFPHAVRMTTSGEREVETDSRSVANADFGIVNFARLMGSVFNDLQLQGKLQPDSIGVGNVRLLLRQGGRTVATIMVPPNGRFEADDVPPGDYDLAVDTNSIPANFVTDVESVPVHIAPVSTVVVNVPLRALRSISGHVYLKVTQSRDPSKPGVPEAKLVPLAGGRLSAGPSTATTSEDGTFVLRNLPAGNLTVSLVPAKVPPPGLTLPSGNVRLPAEPVQVQNATIVLGNSELVPYWVGNDRK